MKKLNKKLLLVIFGILTMFLLSILIIFNYQDYKREYKSVENILNRMNGEPFKKVKDFDNIEKIDNIGIEKELEDKIFMDSLVYTVIIENNEIKDIFSHFITEENKDIYNISVIAENILKKDRKYKIGNLYVNRYSYIVDDNKITIIDNSITRERLFSKIFTSLIIFILLEIVIVIVSNILTKWIMKPVEDTLNKQKQFIEDASHELKTPISVVLANAEMIEVDEKNEKWIDNIKSESLRMDKLVYDLLSLARLENESKELIQINLSNLIEKTMLPLESLMYENDIKLDYHLDEDIYFKCDQERIKQLLVILLDNAIKHSTKKGKIIVNLSKVKNEVVIEVKNNGKEIPLDLRDKIFERFYRGDKSRNRDENRYGLGLAIAKGIVDSHKGKISVFCADGYTTFKVVFKQA